MFMGLMRSSDDTVIRVASTGSINSTSSRNSGDGASSATYVYDRQTSLPAGKISATGSPVGRQVSLPDGSYKITDNGSDQS